MQELYKRFLAVLVELGARDKHAMLNLVDDLLRDAIDHSCDPEMRRRLWQELDSTDDHPDERKEERDPALPTAEDGS